MSLGPTELLIILVAAVPFVVAVVGGIRLLCYGDNRVTGEELPRRRVVVAGPHVDETGFGIGVLAYQSVVAATISSMSCSGRSMKAALAKTVESMSSTRGSSHVIHATTR